jgi:hypothetical protein
MRQAMTGYFQTRSETDFHTIAMISPRIYAVNQDEVDISDDHCLLGCDTVETGRSLPGFLANMQTLSSG